MTDFKKHWIKCPASVAGQQWELMDCFEKSFRSCHMSIQIHWASVCQYKQKPDCLLYIMLNLPSHQPLARTTRSAMPVLTTGS